MSTPQDHPEELLEAMSGGGPLREIQNQELRQHLADCYACATQLRMSARARMDKMTAVGATHLNRIAVSTVLQRMQPSHLRSRPVWMRRWLPIGVGILLLSGSALAATWWSARSEAPLPVVHFSTPAKVARGSAGGRAPALELPWVDDKPIDTNVDLPPANEGKSTGERYRAGHASAAGLFARARDLRLAGNPTAALNLYRQLQERYPHSGEGHLSHIIVGRLWLAQNRADLALQQFSLYLRAGGSALEEALVGQATALARLGRTTEEAAVWRTLSTRLPNSVYAGRARARLAVIDPAAPTGESGRQSR